MSRRSDPHGTSKGDEGGEVGTASALSRRGADAPPERSVRDAEFTLFYQDHFPRLIAHLIVVGVPRRHVVDAAQEAMTLAYRNWHNIDHPPTWVRTVGYRSWLRQHDRECLDDLGSDAHDGHAAQSPNITSELASPAALDAVIARTDFLRLIADLTFNQRQVLAWTYDGYTPSQIAQHLGSSPSTVRSHLANARRALRASRQTRS